MEIFQQYNNRKGNKNIEMESKLLKLKIDLLMLIQINKYDQALKIANEILKYNKDDPLIKKFSKFVSTHKEQIKKFDQEQKQDCKIKIVNDQNTQDWDFDQNQQISISNSSNQTDSQDDEVKFQNQDKILKENDLKILNPLKKIPSLQKLVSIANLKKSELKKKSTQSVKSLIIKKPIELLNNTIYEIKKKNCSKY